jgi:putative chitinase
MIEITAQQLDSLAPQAKAFYRDAFLNGANVLTKYGLNVNALRVAHFMAQVLHESGALTISEESLFYTHAERIRAVWPKRFASVDAAEPYTKNPEKLANFVYGNRKDIGNNQDGDGFRFIGRGLIQITGRDSYTRFGQKLGADLVGDPKLAFSTQWCLQLAAEEWTEKGCNPLADLDDVEGITRKINGGIIGLPERIAWLAKTKKVWMPAAPVAAPTPAEADSP